MGLVLQTQRRAIEALKEFAMSQWQTEVFKKQSGATFYVNNMYSPLCYLGMSEGIGSCSDILGMDVAVFGFGVIPPLRLSETTTKDWGRLNICAYSVLLWPDGHVPVRILETIKSERNYKVNRIDPEMFVYHYRTIELLSFFSFESYEYKSDLITKILLKRTGLIASYIPI